MSRPLGLRTFHSLYPPYSTPCSVLRASRALSYIQGLPSTVQSERHSSKPPKKYKIKYASSHREYEPNQKHTVAIVTYAMICDAISVSDV